MRKRFLLLLLFALTCTSSQVKAQDTLSAAVVHGIQFPTREVTLLHTGGPSTTLSLEIARSPLELRAGLMYRRMLPEHHGMLFIYPEERYYTGFWMQNTFIPLDMVFINGQGQIVQIHRNAQPHDETVIRCEKPVRAVLELNSGAAQSYGLKVGDQIFSSAVFD